LVVAACRADWRVPLDEVAEVGIGFGPRLFLRVTRDRRSGWFRLKYGLTNSHNSEGASFLSTPDWRWGTLSEGQLGLWEELADVRNPYLKVSLRTT
jgi:hypothetical protein